MNAITTLLSFLVRLVTFWRPANPATGPRSFIIEDVPGNRRLIRIVLNHDVGQHRQINAAAGMQSATASSVAAPERSSWASRLVSRMVGRDTLSRPPLYASPGIAAAVIPAHNEEAVIEATLQSVLKVFHRQDIFVFCDNCSDSTADIARAYIPEENVLISGGQYGKSRGLEYVFGSYIFPRQYVYVSVVDADTTLEPKFLVNSLKALQYKDVACTVGQVKSRWYPKNVISVYRTYVYTLWQMIYKRLQSSTNTITIASGCSSTWKTRVLKQLTFDHQMSTEDFSLTIQVHRKHLGKIKYVPSAVVWTQDPFTAKAYWKQMYRWDRAWWESVRKYRVGLNWFQFRKGLPVGVSALDISTLLLTVDMFMFMASVLILPLLLIHPVNLHLPFMQVESRWAIMHSLAWQFATVLVSSFFVACITRRPRVFLYSPVYLVLMYVDIILTLQTVFSTIRSQYRRIPAHAGAAASVWISPERRKEA